MQSAKLFVNGGSQAVRLPRDCQFQGTDVLVRRIGDAVLLVPRDKAWETFLAGLESFSPDFMADGRDQGVAERRSPL